MKSLNSLEISILNNGIDSTRTLLRNQIPYLKVRKREFTGVGIITELSSLMNSMKIEETNFEITNVEGTMSGLENGFGCIIFIRGGQISMIECFTYGEAWPSNMTDYEIKLGCD